jgi:hypothetical protein
MGALDKAVAIALGLDHTLVSWTTTPSSVDDADVGFFHRNI